MNSAGSTADPFSVEGAEEERDVVMTHHTARSANARGQCTDADVEDVAEEEDCGVPATDYRFDNVPLQATPRTSTDGKYGVIREEATALQQLRTYQERHQRLKEIDDGLDERLRLALSAVPPRGDYLSDVLRMVSMPLRSLACDAPMPEPMYPGASIPMTVLLHWKLEGKLTDAQIDMVACSISGERRPSAKITPHLLANSHAIFAKVGPEPGRSLCCNSTVLTINRMPTGLEIGWPGQQNSWHPLQHHRTSLAAAM